MTESETSYSLVQVIAIIGWTWLWLSCLQLATTFVSSSCCSRCE